MDFNFNLIKDLAIGGTALVPIIIGVISLLKKFTWFTDEYAPYAAGGLSVLAYGVVKLLEVYPQYMTVAEPVAFSVYLFLVVSGSYQLFKVSKPS